MPPSFPRFVFPALLAILLAATPGRSQNAELDRADKLLAAFQEKRALLLKPIVDLEDSYDAALQRLSDEFQKKGDLKSILAVQKERDSFRNGRFLEDPPNEITKVRSIFQRELQKRREQLIGPEETLMKTLFSQLEEIKSNLTKEGKIEDAITLNGIMDELKRVGAITDTIANDPVIWEMKSLSDMNEDSQAGIAEEDGKFVIRLKDGKNAGQVYADRMFTPPFVARWVVMTDSHNIRIYMLGGRMILSHENGQEWLEMYEPGRGELLRFENVGRVSPNEYHEIEYEVLEDSFQVSINGVVRAQGRGNYKDLKGSISLGPGAGSVLTLEKFEVRAPVE